MTIKIISKDLKVTPDIEQSVEKKITQRLRKYGAKQIGDRVITVRASERKPFTRVDVDVPYLNFAIHAEAETADGILGGIDKCMDILERQIEKFKTRMHKSKVRSSELKKEILDIVPDDDLIAPAASGDASEDDAPAYKIVKVENYKLKPMGLDEAVLQMEVLDYRFLFFHNTETNVPTVIYKRDDGNIGLIES